MFKAIVLVFAAVLALAIAAPKPSIIATSYSAPIVSAAPALGHFGYAASPLAYSAGFAAPWGYSGYAAPIAATYY